MPAERSPLLPFHALPEISDPSAIDHDPSSEPAFLNPARDTNQLILVVDIRYHVRHQVHQSSFFWVVTRGTRYSANVSAIELSPNAQTPADHTSNKEVIQKKVMDCPISNHDPINEKRVRAVRFRCDVEDWLLTCIGDLEKERDGHAYTELVERRPTPRGSSSKNSTHHP